MMGLIFTVEKDLASPVNSEVHVDDSSDRGYGLMSTFASSQQEQS